MGSYDVGWRHWMESLLLSKSSSKHSATDTDGPMEMTRGQKTSIVRFRDLEPSWHVLAAKEPGYMRWLISWVGGRDEFVNLSLGKAVENEEIYVGYMHLPISQH